MGQPEPPQHPFFSVSLHGFSTVAHQFLHVQVKVKAGFGAICNCYEDGFEDRDLNRHSLKHSWVVAMTLLEDCLAVLS